MDVKCERCSTEYEFDDALVSGRGTTVKCTNCGHKFKIRRSDGDFSEDFWNVTTGDGRTLVFTSLRELQRAIQGYLVERNDRLSRGGLPPKAIGQIPELVPFFEQREAAKRSQHSGRPVRTQDGLGPASTALAQGSTRPRQATKPEFPAPPPHGSNDGANKTTLIGTGPVTEEPAIPAAAPPATRAGARSVVAAGDRATARARSSSRLRRQAGERAAAGAAAAAPARQHEHRAAQRPTPPPAAARDPAGLEPAAAPRARASLVGSGPVAALSAEAAGEGAGASSSPPVVDVSSPLPPRAPRSLLSEIEDERSRLAWARPPASMPDGSRRSGAASAASSSRRWSACALMLGARWAQKNPTTLGGSRRRPRRRSIRASRRSSRRARRRSRTATSSREGELRQGERSRRRSPTAYWRRAPAAVRADASRGSSPGCRYPRTRPTR
ncbi:MAG: zinc-ribbon domain-containing protein [Labilithrix sp.]|nr:zinc-ribbon domain-containing protein [Labilithrix sp.]